MSSGFLKKTLTLSSGVAASQAVMFAATPVLTRLYSPSEFGLFGLLVATASILAVGCHGRYFLAVIQPEDDDDAAGLVTLSLALATAFSLVVAILLLLVRDRLAALSGTPELAGWWWWVPIMVFLAGAYDVFNAWHIRREHWGLASRVQPIRAVALISTQGWGGLAGLGSAGLALGRLFADALMVASLALPVRRDLGRLPGRLQLDRIKTLAKRYRSFPFYGAPQGWLSALGQYLPILVLAWLLDETVVGLFLMSSRLLATPNMFLGKALRQVFYRELHSPGTAEGARQDLWWRTTRAILIWGLAPFSVLMIWGPAVIPYFFGPEWEGTSAFVRPITVWQFMAIIAVPSHMLLVSRDLQRWHLWVETSFLVLRFLALWFGHLVHGAVGAVIGFSLVSTTMQLLLVLLAHRSKHHSVREVDDA